jgi:Transposase, Mutator family
VTRPRVRAVGGSWELHLASYDLFSSSEVLGRLAMEKMLTGLSSRRYTAGLEPAGPAIEDQAAATSKSAVSRRFVAATETALAKLMSRRLHDLDLVALLIDGVHFGEHNCVVALGIGIDGAKHPLAVEEGSTENAALVTELITGLRERGQDVTRPILAVLDGAKALTRAVKDVFDQPLIQRCQQQARSVCGAIACQRRRAGNVSGVLVPRASHPGGWHFGGFPGCRCRPEWRRRFLPGCDACRGCRPGRGEHDAVGAARRAGLGRGAGQFGLVPGGTSEVHDQRDRRWCRRHRSCRVLVPSGRRCRASE